MMMAKMIASTFFIPFSALFSLILAVMLIAPAVSRLIIAVLTRVGHLR